MSAEKARFWTLPNILTLSRILLVLPFLILMLERRVTAALIVVCLAGLTDFLDGFTARTWHQKTRIGIALDPAADKLFLTVSFILLTIPGLAAPNAIPIWLTVIVILRDILITAGAFLIYRLRGSKIFSPSLWGKISTVFQIGTVVFVLFFNALRASPLFLTVLYFLTLAATCVSGFDYFFKSLPLLRRPPQS
jgi:cardiolipin synthase